MTGDDFRTRRDDFRIRGDDFRILADGSCIAKNGFFMLTLLFLICLGQALAVGVHIWVWRLREKSLLLIAVLSASSLVLISFAFFILFNLNFTEPGHSPDPSYDENKVFFQSLFYIGAFDAVLGAFGLYHSFLLGQIWSWKLWIGATLAFWGEMSVAVLLGWLLQVLIGAALRPAFLVSGRDASLWPVSFYALTLFSLALFRPLALKVAREMPTLLQSARRFAGLG